MSPREQGHRAKIERWRAITDPEGEADRRVEAGPIDLGDGLTLIPTRRGLVVWPAERPALASAADRAKAQQARIERETLRKRRIDNREVRRLMRSLRNSKFGKAIEATDEWGRG
jgi:hypothetical protein